MDMDLRGPHIVPTASSHLQTTTTTTTLARGRLERLQAWFLRQLTAVLLAAFCLLSAPRRAASSPGASSLPPVTNLLLKTPAVWLARMIRRREVSSVEVVQAYVDRIREINPLLNAMVKDRFQLALQEAGRADRLVEELGGGYEDALEERLPFLGVPFTVKEAFHLRGMPNSSGLVSRRQVVSGSDAPAVAAVRGAGAIALGVTNCSELCMWVECHNHLYGITRNPYCLERISGGSSGGEGSLLGGAGSVMGVASDGGGSIRMPAFFNGVFGHKPTALTVSNEGHLPAPSSGPEEAVLCPGPMCRYARDLLPLLEVMAGPEAAGRLRLATPVDVAKLRFFSVPHDGGSLLVSPVDAQLLRAQRRVVERLEAELGVRVETPTIPQLRSSFHIWGAMMTVPDGDNAKSPRWFNERLSDHEGHPVRPLWEMLKWTVGLSSHTVAAIGLAAFERLRRSSETPAPALLQQGEALQRRLDEMLGDDGVLLYPPYPRLAPRHHTPLFTPFDFSYACIFNVLGLPVTQVPLGLSAEGLPLGVQVVAGKNQDRLGLAVAVYLEQAFGGWREPGTHGDDG